MKMDTNVFVLDCGLSNFGEKNERTGKILCARLGGNATRGEYGTVSRVACISAALWVFSKIATRSLFVGWLVEGLITKFLNEKVIGSLLISVRVLSDIRTEMDHCSSVSIETRSSVFFFQCLWFLPTAWHLLWLRFKWLKFHEQKIALVFGNSCN